MKAIQRLQARISKWILLFCGFGYAAAVRGPPASYDTSAVGEAPVISYSVFLLGADGWDVLGKGLKADICHLSLCVEDFGPSVWYWRAPEGFLGNMSNAFGGSLTLEMGFFEINRAGRSGFQEEEGLRYDVILENHKHGMRIGIPELIPPGSFSLLTSIALSEIGGWLHTSDGQKATNGEIRKVLSSLANILIRGGYYAGAEHAYLRHVSVNGPPAPSIKDDRPHINAGKMHRESDSLPADTQEEESALQRALRERSLAPEVPQIVIHIGGENSVAALGVTSPTLSSAAEVGAGRTGSVTHTKMGNNVPPRHDHTQVEEQDSAGLASAPTQKDPERRHQAEHDLRHQNGHLSACFDDGSGLPVAQLIQSARVSGTQLIACLSSRDGAFSVSLDTLSYRSASGTTQALHLADVDTVNVDDNGNVVVSSKDRQAAIKGCKMKSFDIDELGTFFETVQDLVASHHPM